MNLHRTLVCRTLECDIWKSLIAKMPPHPTAKEGKCPIGPSRMCMSLGIVAVNGTGMAMLNHDLKMKLAMSFVSLRKGCPIILNPIVEHDGFSPPK